MALGTVYFYACAALALAGALAVVISKNPIRGAMGLLVLVLSVAGLFIALHAQFLAAVQLIVYAGAIVVLFLFVIMLLGPSASTENDRRGIVVRALAGALMAVTGVAAIVLVVRASGKAVALGTADGAFGGIDAIGSVLFSDALVPFEFSSALLMVAVIGAIAVARGRQGARSVVRAAQSPGATVELGEGHSGVFSHESAGRSALPSTAILAGATKEHSA